MNHVHALFLHSPTSSSSPHQTNDNRIPARSLFRHGPPLRAKRCQIAARLDSEFNRLDSKRIEGACMPQQKSRSPGLTNGLSPRYPSRLLPWCQKPTMTFSFLLHVTLFLSVFHSIYKIPTHATSQVESCNYYCITRCFCHYFPPAGSLGSSRAFCLG